jgi:hypothetical protein
MATPNRNSKKPALKNSPIALSEALAGVAEASPGKKISFTIEQIQAWPLEFQQRLNDLLVLDNLWSKMELKRLKWRLRNKKRKLAVLKAAA